MKMFISIVTMLTINSLALARGVSTSGGGYAVVCRGSGQAIKSAELLDLVEGRVRYGLKTFSSSGSEIKDYARAVQNTYELQVGKNWDCTGAAGCMSSADNFQRFMEIVEWVPDRKDLEIVYDLGNVDDVVKTLSPGCHVEQIAIFHDQADKVKISREAWEHLDSVSKAGLVQHELMYHQARRYFVLPEVHSEKSRLNTAMTFSEELLPVHDGVPAEQKLELVFHDINNNITGKNDSTGYYKFLVKDSPEFYKKVYRTQFTHIAGRAVLSKTFVDMPVGVNFMDKYQVQGIQFKGWYVVILPPQSRGNLTGATARLMNDQNQAVMDLQ